jgi:hypothetical protein
MLMAERGGKPRKVRSVRTEIAFEDRYLAATFSSGRISICVGVAITHGYHIPLIFIQKRTPEERTSNRDRLWMNTIQYATEILRPHHVPFIYSLPGNSEDYQTIEDELRAHTANLYQEYRKEYGITYTDWC